MRAYHLDMKCAQFRPDYLASLFARLKQAGYSHVFFEIEDKVRLECIKGAEWCEAYSKQEFSKILAICSENGLTAVPLIQSLGHLEFLLSHRRFHH